MIEENDEPSTSCPKSAAKSAEIASMNDVSEPASNPMKTLMQMAISMIKRSRNKLCTQKQSLGSREEIIGELDEIINFMEAVHTIEDNMTNVKRELKEVKETVIEAAKTAKETAKTAPYAWTAIAAKPRVTDHHEQHHKQELDEQSQQKQAQRRQERAKCQVTLTAEEAPRTTQIHIVSKIYAEITEMLQKAVDEMTISDPSLTIGGFQRLKSNDIRFSCDTEEEANHLRKID